MVASTEPRSTRSICRSERRTEGRSQLTVAATQKMSAAAATTATITRRATRVERAEDFRSFEDYEDRRSRTQLAQCLGAQLGIGKHGDVRTARGGTAVEKIVQRPLAGEIEDRTRSGAAGEIVECGQIRGILRIG